MRIGKNFKMISSPRDLKAQAGYWFQQPAKNKKRVKTGTDILKKSLDSTQYDTGRKMRLKAYFKVVSFF